MLVAERRRPMPKPRRTLFAPNDWLCFWGVFSFAFIVRVFRFSHPHEPYFDEVDFSSANSSSTDQPALGRSAIRLIVKFLKDRSSSWLVQFRFVQTFLSSLVPVFLAAILRLSDVSRWLYFAVTSLSSLEFSTVLRARMIGLDCWTLFLITLSLLLFDIGEKGDRRPLRYASFPVIAVAISFDLSALVVACYEAVLLCRSLRRNRCSRLLILVMLCATAVFVGAVHQGNLRAFRQLIEHRERSPWYIFPLWKFSPRLVWNSETAKVKMFNHPLPVFLSTVFCGVGVLKLESMFYFLAIFWVWLLRETVSCFSFQTAFVFGILAVGKVLARFPVAWLFGFLVFAINAAIFMFWAPWVYAMPVSEAADQLLDLWRPPA
jgi:hypothetical protein